MLAMVVTAVPRKISCVLRAKVAFCLMPGADDVTSGMSRNVDLLNPASIAAYNPTIPSMCFCCPAMLASECSGCGLRMVEL